MSIILGFGSTEEDAERAEEDLIRDAVLSSLERHAIDYVNDDVEADVVRFVADRTAELKEQAKRNKHAENPPERYSEYWGSVLSDASHIVVIMRFLHIARRHALSPDGWACLHNKRVFVWSTVEDEP